MAIRNITEEFHRAREVEKAMATLFFQQCCGLFYGEHCLVPINGPIFTFWRNLGVCNDEDMAASDQKKFAAYLRRFAELLDPPEEPTA